MKLGDWMKHTLEINKISKAVFLRINEDAVMFITNPGRMGDEDGSTFIIRVDNKFKAYRIDGWLYRSKKINADNYISLKDALKHFPKKKL